MTDVSDRSGGAADVLARPAAAADRLSPWDDYAIHQSVATFGSVLPSSPSWAERFYFNLQRPSGELVAIVGGGVYPNRGLAECYLCRLDGETQSNVRAWGRLPAPGAGDGAGVGPFSFRCETPLRAWELTVSLPDDGFAGRFVATRDPFLYGPIDVAADEPNGAFDLFRHFVGAGTIELADGSAKLLSVRDRTWGVRSRRPRLHNWYVLHLGSHFLTLIHQERADGSVHFSECALCPAGGPAEQLRVASHELRFEPVDRQLEEGRLRLAAAGREFELELVRAGPAIRLAGAGYDDGQGDRDAAGGVERDTYDLADPEAARRLGRGTLDAPVRVRLRGDGLDLEGVGVAETAIARDHAAYGRLLR